MIQLIIIVQDLNTDTPQSAVQVSDKAIICDQVTTNIDSITLECSSIMCSLKNPLIYIIIIQLQCQYSWIMSNWSMLSKESR